eukprot:3328573-Alexandrium_andersonii.AAC.1
MVPAPAPPPMVRPWAGSGNGGGQPGGPAPAHNDVSSVDRCDAAGGRPWRLVLAPRQGGAYHCLAS